MTTPIWSYRVPHEHRDILKRVADGLKRDARLGRAIEAALERRSPAPEPPPGPFKDEKAALGFIRDRLALSLDPEAIWLFGSRGRGQHQADSDFDILVVLPDEVGAKADDYRYALEPLLGSGLPCDVVPCSISEFERARHAPGTIAYEAYHAGRKLYQRRRRGRTASRA